jgi:thiamine transport system ATP-binding protein
VTLACEDITVRFGATTALEAVDVSVDRGSVAAILGPSGSGKSTLLRVVAGLQRPDRGTVHWDGRDITDVPPHRRGFGLMFQDYALFPHRTVGQNIAFGPRIAGVDGTERRRIVDDMLRLVGLDGFAGRDVDGLSGGEQQRVALARTLATSPGLVMLDEPLGSLDRTLRDRLVGEMRRIFATVGVTALYVTHDQDEAFSLADRIVVLDGGRVMAVGSPRELWSRPGTVFVARFLGHPNVVSRDELDRIGVPAPPGGTHATIPAAAISLSPGAGGAAILESSSLQSGRLHHEVVIDGVRLTADTATTASVGSHVDIHVDASSVVALESAG